MKSLELHFLETPLFYPNLACSKPTLECDFLKLHFFRISEHSVVYFNIAEKNFNFLSVNFPFGTAKGGWRISAPMIREKFHSVLFRPNSDKEVYSTHVLTKINTQIECNNHNTVHKFLFFLNGVSRYYYFLSF